MGPGQAQRQFMGPVQGQPGPLMTPGGGHMMRPQAPGQMWRHPQEVTLQQRGPQMAVQGEIPGGQPQQQPQQQQQQAPMGQPQPGGSESRPAPPPVLNILPPPAPPDNPQTEEERRQVARYEQWLVQNEAAINEQLKYYETEITKLRKQRKSLNSKQRTLRKSNNELNAQDAAELERVSTEATGLQKSLENWRKQSRQHNMLMTDHKQKQQKATQVPGSNPGPAIPNPGMTGPAQPQPGMRPMGPGQTMITQGAPPGSWQGGNVPPGMVHVQRSPAPGGPAMMVQRMPGQPQQMPQHMMQQRMQMQQQQMMQQQGQMRPGLTIQHGGVVQVSHVTNCTIGSKTEYIRFLKSVQY